MSFVVFLIWLFRTLKETRGFRTDHSMICFNNPMGRHSLAPRVSGPCLIGRATFLSIYCLHLLYVSRGAVSRVWWMAILKDVVFHAFLDGLHHGRALGGRRFLYKGRESVRGRVRVPDQTQRPRRWWRAQCAYKHGGIGRDARGRSSEVTNDTELYPMNHPKRFTTLPHNHPFIHTFTAVSAMQGVSQLVRRS